jgi:hypothetical protein
MLEFWTRLTAQQIFEVLSDPPRVAGPWLDAWVDSGGVERQPPCRKTPDGMTVVWDRDGMVSVHAVAFRAASPKPVACATRKEADEVLRKEGWLLV